MTAADRWNQFLDYSISELESFGCEVRHLNMVQEKYGLFLRDLQTVTPEDLYHTKGLAKQAVSQIRHAISLLFEEIVVQGSECSPHERRAKLRPKDALGSKAA